MKPRASAFTLLEMTLALAASAVILAAIFGIFSKAIHLRDDATARMRAVRQRARAINILRNDLTNARVTGGTDRTLAASLEGSQASHGAGFPGYLRFTTTTALDNLDDLDNPAADVQEVEYYIVSDPSAQDRRAGQLVRTVNTDLMDTTRTQLDEQPLLSGVMSIDIEFYDGSEWKNSWNISTTDQTLPLAVRVLLQLANGAPIEVLVPWTTQPTSPITLTNGSTTP